MMDSILEKIASQHDTLKGKKFTVNTSVAEIFGSAIVTPTYELDLLEKYWNEFISFINDGGPDLALKELLSAENGYFGATYTLNNAGIPRFLIYEGNHRLNILWRASQVGLLEDSPINLTFKYASPQELSNELMQKTIGKTEAVAIRHILGSSQDLAGKLESLGYGLSSLSKEDIFWMYGDLCEKADNYNQTHTKDYGLKKTQSINIPKSIKRISPGSKENSELISDTLEIYSYLITRNETDAMKFSGISSYFELFEKGIVPSLQGTGIDILSMVPIIGSINLGKDARGFIKNIYSRLGNAPEPIKSEIAIQIFKTSKEYGSNTRIRHFICDKVNQTYAAQTSEQFGETFCSISDASQLIIYSLSGGGLDLGQSSAVAYALGEYLLQKGIAKNNIPFMIIDNSESIGNELASLINSGLLSDASEISSETLQPLLDCVSLDRKQKNIPAHPGSYEGGSSFTPHFDHLWQPSFSYADIKANAMNLTNLQSPYDPSLRLSEKYSSINTGKIFGLIDIGSWISASLPLNSGILLPHSAAVYCNPSDGKFGIVRSLHGQQELIGYFEEQVVFNSDDFNATDPAGKSNFYLVCLKQGSNQEVLFSHSQDDRFHEIEAQRYFAPARAMFSPVIEYLAYS